MREPNWDAGYRTKFGFRKKFIFIPFIAAGVLALVSYIVMQLWNNLLPDILNTGTITYWQAMGLFVLAKILFGFGRGGRGPWMHHRMERFKNMSPEEQQRFREEMRSRCGGRRGWRGDWANWEQKPAAEDTGKPTE